MQSGQPPPGEDPFRQPGYGEMPTFPDPFAPAPPTTPPPPPPMTPPGPQPPPPDPYAPYPPAYPPAPGLAGYGAPPSAQSNALGVLALVFGISAIPLGACCGLLGGALGVAGVVLGLLGIRKSDQGQATNRGLALAGAICGGAGILVSILFLMFSLAAGLTPLR